MRHLGVFVWFDRGGSDYGIRGPRYGTGLVVESDLLDRKVGLATREQDLIRARNNLELAATDAR